MLRESRTGGSWASVEVEATSNRLRSVWQNSQRFASAAIVESHTGQTLVSLGGVDAHLETRMLVLDPLVRTKTFRYRYGE